MEDNKKVLLELSSFAKSIFSDNDSFDINKDPNKENYFEPTPNGFYGFAIDLTDVNWRHNSNVVQETEDIDYVDISNQPEHIAFLGHDLRNK